MKAAEKLATRPGASAIFTVPQDKVLQIQRAIDLEKAGDPTAASTLFALRKELGGESFDGVYDTLSDSNLRVIDNAEAAKIKGRGLDDENTITNKFPNEALDPEGKIVGEIKVVNGIATMTNGKPIPRQTFNFVITRDNRLIIGKKHTTLSNAKDVLAAGNIVFKGGKVRMIDNLSGHFRPTVEESLRFPELLRSQGFDVSGANLKLYEFVIDSDGIVEGRSLVVNEYLK